MELLFKEDDHSYKCDTGINWTSVTSIVSSYVQPFDAKAQAIKSSRNKRSKWYKMPVEEILQEELVVLVVNSFMMKVV